MANLASRPEADTFIAHTYSVKSSKDKKLNKAALCAAQGWNHVSWPVLFVPLSLVRKDGAALLAGMLEAFDGEEIHVLVMGALPKAKLPENVQIVSEDEALFHQALAGSDMLLLPSVPQEKFKAQRLAWRYGSVPVLALEHSYNGASDNYEPVMEGGTSFLFREGSMWSMHAALVRAQETYRLPYDWTGIQRNGFQLG